MARITGPDENGGVEGVLLEALAEALVTPKLTESQRRSLRERVLEAAARTAPAVIVTVRRKS